MILTRLRRAAWTALASAALLVVPAACDGDDPQDLLLQQVHRHANGLIVPQPDGFEVIENPDGFLFREEGMIRAPRLLQVSLSPVPPHFDADGRRPLPDGETASHATIRREGGSGGRLYELIVWRPVDGGWIVISELAQSEWGTPRFSVAWALIERTRFDRSQ